MILDRNLDPEIRALCNQVTENCNLSDARYAGSFSLCGLLLRLRDYFKWEHGLPPWAEVDSPVIMSWIDDKESSWEEMIEEDLRTLQWRGRLVEPLDSEPINQDLAPMGLFYGAGLAAFLKPSFFLGRVVREQELDGVRVCYLGEELVRDLFTSPAMTLGGVIVARRGPLSAFLWDTIQYGEKSRRKAIHLASWVYGLNSEPAAGSEGWIVKFESMVNHELEPLVRHEFGEISDSVFPKESWRRLISAHPHSRIELMARTIKDVLADTGDAGRLNYIVETGRLGSLAVFAAFHDGLAARIFEEFTPAFDRFLEQKEWEIISEAREKGWRKSAEMARQLAEIADEGYNRPDWAVQQVERLFYQPLGL